MSKYLIGVVSGLAGLAAGGWLIAAPFALGYQRSGADWVDATKIDFITGIVLAVIGLAVAVLFALAARERLFEIGALVRRVPAPAAHVAGPVEPVVTRPASGTDLQAMLAPLVAAMAADQANRDAGRVLVRDASRNGTSAGGQDDTQASQKEWQS